MRSFSTSFSSSLCSNVVVDGFSEILWPPGAAGSQVEVRRGGEADKGDGGNDGAGLSEEIEAEGLSLIGAVGIADSSLGACFASGGGLVNGGTGVAVDWRLDMKLGFGASGGGVPTFPVVDPLREGATGTGTSKAWGNVRS